MCLSQKDLKLGKNKDHQWDKLRKPLKSKLLELVLLSVLLLA